MILGSAYIFTSSDNGLTWSEKHRVSASNGVDGNRFGNSVSIYGNTAAVGSIPPDPSAGIYNMYNVNIVIYNHDMNTRKCLCISSDGGYFSRAFTSTNLL